MPPTANNDRYAEHALPDDFPISTLGSLREKIIAPGGAFDPQRTWTQTFRIYNNGPNSSAVGKLVIERRAGPGQKVSLKVRHEKMLSGATHVRSGGGARRVLDAVLQVGPEPSELSTPRTWSFTTKVFDNDGSAIPDLSLKRTAAVKNGTLRVTTGNGSPRKYDLPGKYTVCWALFDAVARLPRERFDPIAFTLIDHFDQVKPDQTLVFRRTIETTIGGKKVRLHGYDQTGRGIMPFTYWIDHQGRTVAAISGLEAYLLETA